MRTELELALSLARELDAADLPYFIGELETIRCVALARLITPNAVPPPDKSLTIKQASKRLGVGCSYLYHHWQEFKFARQEGRKILFSSNGIDVHLKGKRR